MKSAGNRGTGDGRVTSPGNGYNVLAVGNVNLGGTAARADDVMAADVQLRRPDLDGRRPREAGDRGARDEHPDAVERVPVGRPDRQRHQLRRADGRRDGCPSDPAQAVPRHLAGAAPRDPDVERSEQHRGRDTALRRRRRGDDRRQHGRPDPRRQPPRRPAGRLQHVRPLAGRVHDHARADQRLRAAISWTADPSAPDHANRPSADLDLEVRGPSGSVFSSSWDNTSEIVDFRAPTTGTYEIRVINFRCARSTFVGWAHTNG